MPQDLSAELGKLLDQYDANRRALDERKRQVKRDEDGFLDGFAQLRAGVIRPVFEASGAILKARGHARPSTTRRFNMRGLSTTQP